ncbi:MAG: type II secretory pathway protein, partial [Candidatus Omnitrophota bacterium]|nr:type II secretory pathway protein [Candidatus Omnitrophota bacterium]
RLSVAGLNNGGIFQEDAFEEIFKFSGGIPRLINILCDKALLSGFTADKKTIDSRMVKKCAKEIEGIFDEG